MSDLFGDRRSLGNLRFPPVSDAEFKPMMKVSIASGEVERFDNKPKEDETMTKKPKRKILGQEWVVKIACLYNRTKAGTPTLGKELGISESSAWRLKQKAIEQGLIKEDKPVNVVREDIKKEPLTKEEASDVDVVESETKLKPIICFGNIEFNSEVDVDQIMIELDSNVKKAEQLLEVAHKHRQAAADCAKVLGVDKCHKVVQVLFEQLESEFNNILAKEGMSDDAKMC